MSSAASSISGENQLVLANQGLREARERPVSEDQLKLRTREENSKREQVIQMFNEFQRNAKLREPQGCIQRLMAKPRYRILTSTPVKLTSVPIRIISGISSWVTNRFGFNNIAYNITHYEDLFQRYINSETSLKPIAPTINRHQEPKDFYLNRGGLCSGASLYFNLIFLKQTGEMLNPKQTLIKIASMFATGVPKEAAMIDTSVMGLLRELHFSDILTLIPGDKSDLAKGEIHYENINDITKFPPGVYMIRITYLSYSPIDYHAISLIKISDTEAYIFDPAKGLFEFRGDNIPRQINNHLTSSYRTLWKFHASSYFRTQRLMKDNGFSLKDFSNLQVRIIPTNPNSIQKHPIFSSPNEKSLVSPKFDGSLNFLSDVLKSHFFNKVW